MPVESLPRGRAPLRFWLRVAVVALVALAVHADSFRLPHVEGDEVIFTFLAERLAQDPSAYHLQGALEGAAARRFVRDAWGPRWSPPPGHPRHAQAVAAFAALDRAEVLLQPFTGDRTPAYDPTVYDRPFFFHPPVYPYALAAARSLGGRVGGVLLSALAHVATAVLVAWIGLVLCGPTAGLIAAGLVAVDPVLWLAGSRLWIDGFAAMAATAAVAAALVVRERHGLLRYALLGIVVGLAVLTKLSTVLIVPAVLVAVIRGPRRPRPADLLVAGAVLATMVLAWLAVTHAHYGAYFPTVRITPWILARSPYVRMVAERPWHFYASALLIVAPVYAFVLGALRPGVRSAAVVPAVWALGVVGGLGTLQVFGFGGGAQLRYLAPAMPGLALLAATALAHAGWRLRAVAGALVLVGTISGWASTSSALAAEPYPVAVDLLLARTGRSVPALAPGLWTR